MAGNVLSDINIGSAEYAAEHLKVPLIIVLGHKSCGAVKAAVAGVKAEGYVSYIVEALTPAVEEARKSSTPENLAENAAHINVERTVKALAESEPVLSKLVKEKKLKIVGAYYDVDNGKVELLRK